ncbi:MAG: hypothetical protein LBL16_01490 [Endomicrobium sp.]|nr:hypothetical protein [Endomicrobium sp.]
MNRCLSNFKVVSENINEEKITKVGKNINNFLFLSTKANKLNINNANTIRSILIPRKLNKNREYRRQLDTAPIPIYCTIVLMEF